MIDFTNGYDSLGIYALYNVQTNSVYIGMSKNIKRRIAQHIYHFDKSDVQINPMYGESIEDFICVVVHKINADDYERFGTLLENIYILEALDANMNIYNIHLQDEESIYWSFKFLFETKHNIDMAFLKSCGAYPHNLCRMRPERKNRILNRE